MGYHSETDGREDWRKNPIQIHTINAEPKVTQAMSPVKGSLEALSERTNILIGQIQELEKRIDPVLERILEKGEVAIPCSDSSGSCAMECSINAIYSLIVRAQSIVGSMHERLRL